MATKAELRDELLAVIAVLEELADRPVYANEIAANAISRIRRVIPEE
jgi:hypothetical protein